MKKQKQSPEERLAAALEAARAEGDDLELAAFRRELLKRLRRLVPVAVRQAKEGKPALLRILTRLR